ncbi:MAG: hypothetical protein LBG60_09525 [Bifidobacteriaceae bacterium]|nr:hypothetical protein [Bifidobacteriaceae bacterium]
MIAAALAAACSQSTPVAPSRPAARAYVAPGSGGYTLNVVEACPDVSISRVVVKCAEPDKSFDQLPTVWEAHADAPVRSAVLFADAAGLVADAPATGVDHSRELVVWWDEGADQEGSVSGRLSDLAPTDVLWAKGVEDQAQFEQKQPEIAFGC